MVHDDDNPIGNSMIDSEDEPLRTTPPPNDDIRDAILELAREHPHWGRLTIHETLTIEHGLHIDQSVVNYVLMEYKMPNLHK